MSDSAWQSRPCAAAIPALTVRGRRNSSLPSSDSRILSATSRAALGVGLRQEDHELLATVAGDRVETPRHGIGQVAGHVPEGVVAGAVAEGVVVGLEVVDVQEHQGEAAPEAPGPLRLALQLPLEEASVVQARELVGEGEGPDGRLEADALEGHRELAGDGRAGGEGRGLEGEEAQRAALPHEGQDGEASGLVASGQVIGPDEARLDAELAGRPGASRRSEREHP